MEIHLIGNAHVDPVWLWKVWEGMAEVKATFRSALDRMKEFPDYKFTSACAAYYEWVEHNAPEMFEEIKQRVAEGRWCITGGWYIQPDCNLPGGESFARHGLYSQRYFQEKFGKIAVTGYNVDSFGHNAMLPQLLKKSGLKNYVFMRPSEREKQLEHNLFRWRSADGSEVNTFRIPYHYNISIRDMEEILPKFEQAAKETPQMAFYGVGNHGGGPTIAILNALCAKIEAEPDTYKFSTPDEYFLAAGEKLPVFQGELQHHARGCYSANASVKKSNRQAEHALTTAEKLQVTAEALFGESCGTQPLKQAWKGLLFNQFHDILCGCSLKEAYADAEHLYGEVFSISGRTMNFALQKISWNIDTSGGMDLYASKDKNWKLWEAEGLGTPIVIFNPLSWEVTQPILCAANVNFVTDQDGAVVASQKTRAGTNVGEEMWSTLFQAKLPAMGYCVYRLFKNAAPPREEAPAAFSEGAYELENPFLCVKINADSGCISSIYQKEEQREYLRGSVAKVMDEEHCDTWAHDIDSFGRQIGKFGQAAAECIENGPVRKVVRVRSTYGASVLTQDFILYHNLKQVDVRARIDWREQHKMLKLSFDVNVTEARAVAEIPYGWIERETDGGEEPCQQWIDLLGCTEDHAVAGLALLNDSKYSYDALQSTLSMTVLRSPIYADHGGERDGLCEFMEQGVTEFCYSICPHSGDFKEAGLVKRAYERNIPPQWVVETFHKGRLGCFYEGILISKDNLIASALKKAEDGGGYILRVYECDGCETQAEISLPALGRTFIADFSPCEIKTFYLPKERDLSVRETNFLED